MWIIKSIAIWESRHSNHPRKAIRISKCCFETPCCRFSVSPQRGGQAPPPPAHCQLPTHAFLFLLRLLLFLSNCMLSNSEGLLKQNADMFSAFTPPATAFIFIPFEWTERMCMKSYLIRHTWHYAYEWRLCLLLFTWTVFTLLKSASSSVSMCFLSLNCHERRRVFAAVLFPSPFVPLR